MITPEDIDKKEFTKGRGYKEEEVDAFLDKIAVDMQNLIDENHNLLDKNIQLSAEYNKLRQVYTDLYNSNQELRTQYDTLQQNLYSTLESAKNLMSGINESSERKADLIVENAKLEAENMLRVSRENLARLQQQESMLKDRVVASKTRFKYILESELKSLENLDMDVVGVTVKDEFDEFLESLEKEKKEKEQDKE